MRINLNFKDARIQRMNESEFKIEFDLSKMIKPRLSPDARMYIEHFNLPEFIDEKFGRDKGDLRGYFEIRTDNIDSNDFDSEYGNTGNTIIYTSPLNNFGTFTNNDPMYISNFKISQNFLRDKLSFILKIFDRNGDPFTTSVTMSEEITHDTEYATYQTDVTNLTTLQTELEDAKITLNVLNQRLKTQRTEKAIALTAFYEKRGILFKKMDELLFNKKYGVENKIKVSTLKVLFENPSINEFNYIFEDFIHIQITKDPYKLFLTELNEFYEKWVKYAEFNQKVQGTEFNINDINSAKTNIWYNSTSEYQPSNINVKSEILNNIDYTTDTGKTGKIDIQTFNSVINTTTTTIIGDITPTVGEELDVADVVIIDKSKFTSSISKKFEYYFIKTANDKPTGVTFSARANETRFSLKVVRNDNSYSYEFTNDVPTKGAKDNTEIKIKGSVLGGLDVDDDLVINIDTVYVPAPSQVYTFSNYVDVAHNDNGTMDIDIKRDNATLVYDIDSSDFSKTKNYNVTEIIKIDGDRVGGDTKTHDVSLEVLSVIIPETRYTVDDMKINHSIETVTINKENSSAFDSGGTEKPSATNYSFKVFSENGVYETIFNDANDSSSGFANGDVIKIKGSTLSGEDTTNDLVVEVVTTMGSGKIETIQVESKLGTTYVARNASSYKFDVIVKANDENYYVEYKSGNQFKVNDVLEILGNDLGGKTGNNDLEFTITELIKDTNEVKSIRIVGGVALPDTGAIGQIKTVAITGTAKRDEDDGRWIQSQTSLKSGTPVDIATMALPALRITLGKVAEKGIAKIEKEITDKYADIKTSKTALNTVKTLYYLDLDTMPDKIKCFNCSLVLYDEIPEYSQASSDAISGNTYSRLNGCQFKRI